MKRLLVVLVLCVLVVVPVASADSWPILTLINKSVGFLEEPNGSCTAFSINERKGTYLTAYHCVDTAPDQLMIDGNPAEVLATFVDDDLAILRSRPKPALRLGLRPNIGDEVLAVGHGTGAPFTTALVGLITSLENYPPWENPVKLMWSTPTYMGGMSGGPIINRAGLVVSVVKCGFENLGCSVRYSAVGRVMAQYR